MISDSDVQITKLDCIGKFQDIFITNRWPKEVIHNVEYMRRDILYYACIEAWCVYIIIHVIYCWQVQVSVKNSLVWELHQHNTTSVPSIERDMKAWASSTIVGYKWKTTRLQSTSTLEREWAWVRDMDRERGRQVGVVPLAWRLVGHCVGLLPVDEDLY